MQAKSATLPTHSQTGRAYDELLVTLVWQGDRRAAERLASRWQPRLLRTAMRLLGDPLEAQGAVQDSWVSIWRGLGTLKDPARFAPWAFGILQRRCADTIRGQQRRRRHETGSAAASEPACQPTSDDTLAIREAFAALSPEQNLAAQLFFVEGLTLAEIAQAQGVPIGTAKSRLFHARRHLKAALTNDQTGETP